MKKKIFNIIEVDKDNNQLSRTYDIFMIIIIAISIIPLMTKNTTPTEIIIDKICLLIFILDYIARLITADLKYKTKNKPKAYIRHIISPMAIVDLLSILPYITHINRAFKLFRLFRLAETLKVFRVFKVIRYSKTIQKIVNVIKHTSASLLTVGIIAIAYIFIASLLIFNAEPESFNTFFDAIYFSTISLTTIGYGDIYPTTTIGKFISMISSLIGIAIIALPSSIITAGYMKEKNK